jgi:hypothetical protein
MTVPGARNVPAQRLAIGSISARSRLDLGAIRRAAAQALHARLAWLQSLRGRPESRQGLRGYRTITRVEHPMHRRL